VTTDAAGSAIRAGGGAREAALALALGERHGERRLVECVTGRQESVLGAARLRRLTWTPTRAP
jgi:hypothetical protein